MEVFEGRPESCEGRMEKECAVYDLLDRLGIPFLRADHEAVMTMEGCQEIDSLLEHVGFEKVEMSGNQITLPEGSGDVQESVSVQRPEDQLLPAADAGR